MTDNLRHWSALEKTDRSATKPFERAGGFKGTATKPIYHEKRMTEHFGPCGIGWGMNKPEFQLVPAENEILVYCTVALWYVDGEQRGEVFGVGGDKVVAQQKRGPFVSDEAFKAAFTDALGNAMKHLGVSADIHMGEFDKYGRDRDDAPAPRERSASPPQRPAQPASPPQAPTSGQQSRPFAEPAATGRDATSTAASHTRSPTGSVPPPNPEEPPEIAEARRIARSAFWSRDDYGIDPAVIQGGMARWDAEFIAQADAAPNIDAFLKLKQDNKEAGYAAAWEDSVQPAVIRHFRQRCAEIENRLSGKMAAA